MDSIGTITIDEPFASAIFDGPRRVENRDSRLELGSSNGRWIAVHSAKTLDEKKAREHSTL